MITDKEILQPFEELKRNRIVLAGTPCRQGKWNKIEENQMYMVGKIIAIGVDTEQLIDINIIPSLFNCPLTGNKYSLLRLVNYSEPSAITRTSSFIGHYTAVVRRNLNWVVFTTWRPKKVKNWPAKKLIRGNNFLCRTDLKFVCCFSFL